MYQAKGKPLPLDQELARHCDERLQAAVTLGYGAHDAAQAEFLRQNVQLFAAAKTAHETEALSALLLDDKGNIKAWPQFKTEALVLHDQYNVRWLSAEYEHAVASAQMAARWQEFEPTDMLEYQTVGDERVRAEHRAWDGITRPADDAWWQTHYPPNGWFCRCLATVAAVGAGATPKQVLKALPDPDPLFSNNVGQTGIIFPEGHPYFDALPGDQRTALARPSGAYEAFKYSKSGPFYRQNGIRTALNSINEVHELPEALRSEAATPISFGKIEKNASGEFDYTNPADLRIRLNAALGSRAEVATTLLHEIGHYLDYTSLEPAGQLTRFSADSDLVLVINAARKTKAFRTYEQVMADSSALVFDTDYAEYLSRPEEMWARAYAQYIAEKSGDEELLAAIAERAGLSIPNQWNREDFAPIREAIDQLFVYKKWTPLSE